jgi:outer membrane cobalamin receptor
MTYRVMTTILWGLLAVAGTAWAEPAPGDSLEGEVPAGPALGPADSLESRPVAVAVPQPGAPVPGTPVLGNERFITARPILELASGSLGEALAFTPGVDLVRTGWHGLPQTLRLRGGRTGDIVWLLDGIPFSDGQMEAIDLNWLPVVGLGICEVAEGGLSSVHGSGAVTGVVGMQSVTTMPEFPESDIRAWWGSFDGRAVSLRFNRRITERVGVMSTYENVGSGGWTDHSSADTDRFLGKATALFGSATRVDLMAYRYKGEFGWPDSCPGVPSTHSGDRRNERNLLAMSVLSGEMRRLNVDYHHLETSESYSSAGTTYVDEGIAQGVDIGFLWLAPDSARTGLVVGLKSRRLRSTYLGNRTSTDLYLSALRERKTERLALQGSVRLAKNSGFDAEAAAGLAARFAVRERLFLFSRVHRDYAFPRFSVLFNGGRDGPADPEVRTETSWGLELGLALEGGPLSASVSVFGRDTAGLALWVTDDSCRAYLDPDVRIRVTGLETSLGLSLPPWFEAEVSYSVLHARDGSGASPAYVPQQALVGTARVDRRFSKHVSAGMRLAARYIPPTSAGPRIESCERAACLPDAQLSEYVSAMLNLYVDIDRVTTYFKIQNLVNDHIEVLWGRPSLPPRSYEFGTSWRLLD